MFQKLVLRTSTPRPMNGLFVALGPLLVIGVLFVVTPPAWSRAMNSEPVTVLNIPLDLFFMAFALWWSAMGGYWAGTSRFPLATPVALMFFTVPACVAILFAPAIVLILQNLAV